MVATLSVRNVAHLSQALIFLQAVYQPSVDVFLLYTVELHFSFDKKDMTRNACEEGKKRTIFVVHQTTNSVINSF